jgi:Tfp pilus assembly protein PilX
MNFLFKALVRNRSKDRGFVIPVVIALGLIMSLLGTISIFQSNDENLTASSQRATARALAAAEIGVARYRELIDKYRIIATYPACVSWNTTTGNCDDTGTTKSWKNISAVKDTTATSLINASCPANGSTAVVAMAVRGWQYIDSTNPSLGQYRLWNYTYISNYSGGAYTSQPVGRLIVEGRFNQNNTNLTNESQAAVANIEVDLPIQPGIPTPNAEIIQLEGNFNRFNPALWITGTPGGTVNASVTNASGLKVNGNIIVTDADCNITATIPTTANLQTPNTQSIIIDARQPGYKTPPTAGATNLDADADVDVNSINASDINNGVTLPRSGDFSETRPDGSVYYHYLVDGAVNLDEKDLNIVAGTKVILYLNGNITLKGNPDPDGGGPLLPQPVNLNFRTGNNNKSYHLEIYGSNSTTAINLQGKGAINIKALIHAPNATVNVTQDVNNDPTVIINGAVWVKDWNGSSSLTTPVTISPDDPTDTTKISEQYSNYTYIKNDLVSAGARVVDPVISTPSRWETKQVN